MKSELQGKKLKWIYKIKFRKKNFDQNIVNYNESIMYFKDIFNLISLKLLLIKWSKTKFRWKTNLIVQTNLDTFIKRIKINFVINKRRKSVGFNKW